MIIKNDPVILPKFLIVNKTEENLSEFILEIAANMGLDIIYLSPKYYKSHISDETFYDKVQYQYYQEQNVAKYNLDNITSEIKSHRKS